MALLQRYRRDPMSAAKHSAVLAGAAAAAFGLAKFAVPYSVAALSDTVPRLWSSVRFLLVPPYLFITVHLIIAAIWKLSDQRLPRDPAAKPADGNAPPPPKAASAEPDLATPGSGAKSAGSSCVTSDSDDSPAVSSRFEPTTAEIEGAMGMEDTWQTIVMKKSATWERSSDTVAVAAEAADDATPVRRSATFTDRPAAEANDELNQRFEAFIKKNYDQIRSY